MWLTNRLKILLKKQLKSWKEYFVYWPDFRGHTGGRGFGGRPGWRLMAWWFGQHHIGRGYRLVGNQFLHEWMMEEVRYIHEALAADEPGLGSSVDAVAGVAAGDAAAVAGVAAVGRGEPYFSDLHWSFLYSSGIGAVLTSRRRRAAVSSRNVLTSAGVRPGASFQGWRWSYS